MQRHADAIKEATPNSDPLVTTWPIKEPPYSASTSTPRGSGQSDAEFVESHTVEFLLDMMTDNPDPA